MVIVNNSEDYFSLLISSLFDEYEYVYGMLVGIRSLFSIVIAIGDVLPNYCVKWTFVVGWAEAEVKKFIEINCIILYSSVHGCITVKTCAVCGI